MFARFFFLSSSGFWDFVRKRVCRLPHASRYFLHRARDGCRDSRARAAGKIGIYVQSKSREDVSQPVFFPRSRILFNIEIVFPPRFAPEDTGARNAFLALSSSRVCIPLEFSENTEDPFCERYIIRVNSRVSTISNARLSPLEEPNSFPPLRCEYSE